MGFFEDDSVWGPDPFSDSFEMQHEAAATGFDWPHAIDVIEKIREEIDELAVAIRNDDPDAAAHEIGDLFLALINIARKLDLEPHHVMRRANDRFRKRFVRMRLLIESEGRTLERCSLEELDKAWDTIKRVDDAK